MSKSMVQRIATFVGVMACVVMIGGGSALAADGTKAPEHQGVKAHNPKTISPPDVGQVSPDRDPGDNVFTPFDEGDLPSGDPRSLGDSGPVDMILDLLAAALLGLR